MDNVYEVEEICGKRKRRAKIEYQVKWRGYGEEEMSWEPAGNILDKRLIDAFTEKSKKPAEKRKLTLKTEKSPSHPRKVPRDSPEIETPSATVPPSKKRRVATEEEANVPIVSEEKSATALWHRLEGDTVPELAAGLKVKLERAQVAPTSTATRPRLSSSEDKSSAESTPSRSEPAPRLRAADTPSYRPIAPKPAAGSPHTSPTSPSAAGITKKRVSGTSLQNGSTVAVSPATSTTKIRSSTPQRQQQQQAVISSTVSPPVTQNGSVPDSSSKHSTEPVMEVATVEVSTATSTSTTYDLAAITAATSTSAVSSPPSHADSQLGDEPKKTKQNLERIIDKLKGLKGGEEPSVSGSNKVRRPTITVPSPGNRTATQCRPYEQKTAPALLKRGLPTSAVYQGIQIPAVVNTLRLVEVEEVKPRRPIVSSARANVSSHAIPPLVSRPAEERSSLPSRAIPPLLSRPVEERAVTSNTQ